MQPIADKLFVWTAIQGGLSHAVSAKALYCGLRLSRGDISAGDAARKTYHESRLHQRRSSRDWKK